MFFFGIAGCQVTTLSTTLTKCAKHPIGEEKDAVLNPLIEVTKCHIFSEKLSAVTVTGTGTKPSFGRNEYNPLALGGEIEKEFYRKKSERQKRRADDERTQLMSNIAALTKQKEAINAKVANLRKEESQLHSSIQKLKGEHSLLTANKSKITIEYDQLLVQITQKQIEHKSLEDNFNYLNRLTDELQRKESENYRISNDLKTAIEKREIKIKNLELKCNNLCVKMEKKEATLMIDINHLESQAKELIKKKEETELAQSKEKQELHALQAESVNQRKELNTLRPKTKAAQENFEALQSEFNALKLETEKERSELNALKSEIEKERERERGELKALQLKTEKVTENVNAVYLETEKEKERRSQCIGVRHREGKRKCQFSAFKERKGERRI